MIYEGFIAHYDCKDEDDESVEDMERELDVLSHFVATLEDANVTDRPYLYETKDTPSDPHDPAMDKHDGIRLSQFFFRIINSTTSIS